SEITSFKAQVSSMDSSLLSKLPALKAIDSFFMPIEKVSSGGAEHLKSAIKTSGLFLEAGIKELIAKGSSLGAGGSTAEVKKEMISMILKQTGGDFKGALIKLQAALKESVTVEILKLGNVKPEELALSVDKIIKNIEFFQIQSKVNDTLDLFVPFFWKSLRDGELVFSESYKGPSDTKSYSCTINLDLESAGRVSAIVLLMYDSVHLSFVAERKEFIALINENSGELKAKFKELGLPLGSVRASREENIDFDKCRAKPAEEGFNIKA
ncbi:MAG: flagellar hook-length control protein FliK, partial [Proteobacteria bacterium]|nr:flagellar hook-length control protein FliK [Pseudomonadota bacterium]